MWYSGAQFRAHSAQVGGEELTVRKLIQMRQCKVNCCYFGGVLKQSQVPMCTLKLFLLAVIIPPVYTGRNPS